MTSIDHKAYAVQNLLKECVHHSLARRLSWNLEFSFKQIPEGIETFKMFIIY